MDYDNISGVEAVGLKARGCLTLAGKGAGPVAAAPVLFVPQGR